jgi:multidrug efflux pump subunit AcrA (membrane-fusion protein)
LLPQFAIIENDDGTFVRRPDGSEVPVTTGIRSQDGMVEIISGLAAGDQVVNIGLKSSQ